MSMWSIPVNLSYDPYLLAGLFASLRLFIVPAVSVPSYSLVCYKYETRTIAFFNCNTYRASWSFGFGYRKELVYVLIQV